MIPKKNHMATHRQNYKNLSWLVWIEESVPRDTVRHHEACRVMPNSDPEGQIFKDINQHFNMRMIYFSAVTVEHSVLQLQFYIMQCSRQEMSFLKSLLDDVGEVFWDNLNVFMEQYHPGTYTFPGIMDTICAWIFCKMPGWDNMDEVRISIPCENHRFPYLVCKKLLSYM